MHIPKLFAVFSLAAFCAGSLQAQKPDSPDQVKAREALHQALGQTGSPPAVTPPAAAPAATAKPPTQPPAQHVAQAPVNPPLTWSPPPPMAAPVTAPVAMAAPMAMPQQTMPEVPPAKTLTPEQEEKAREAMHKAMQDLDAKQPSAPVVATPPPAKPVVKPAVVAAPVAVKTTQPSPAKTVVAPAPATGMTNTPATMGAVPGSKEARLAELTELYKAGSITPTEYQERRAKIRAEPDKQ